MDPLLRDLVEVLSLERLELNLFRGPSRNLGGRSMYGGQIIGQAMVAASHTVEDREPHSLHAYFLLPGDMKLPVVYEVDRLRDGKSFSVRRVEAIQHGRPILSMIASFHKSEEGFEHQVPMPDVPPPESLRPWHELVHEWIDQSPDITDEARAALTADFCIEFRPVDPVNPLHAYKRDTRGAMWFRATAPLPDQPWLHRCVLAYASDWGLLGAALRPYGRRWFERDMMVASIDHALWFHRPARADEWLLYVTDSHTAQSARGLSRGMIFDTAGRLVASAAQEGLMRPVEVREQWVRSVGQDSGPAA
ncbi:MAG: acyl-CoA thioesterase [Panacagrimonas sp.]